MGGEPPKKYLLVTEKYGFLDVSLNPQIERGCSRCYENRYSIEIPQELTAICEEIRRMGGRALLVGGAVRDVVMATELGGLRPETKDFDIEVYGLSPSSLMRIFGTTFDLGPSAVVGKAFGVLKISIHGWKNQLDVSIPRSDSKISSGHGGFEVTTEPSMSIAEAAKRRDLTMNSFAYDPLTKKLYDPYGGVEDIRRKMIRVTDPELFQDDPLRVLRIMQFAARLDVGVDEETVSLCRTMVERGDLDELSAQRVHEEIVKMTERGLFPSRAMRFALETGIVQKYWPEMAALVGVPQQYSEENPWHPEGDVWEHSLQTADAAAEIARREGLDREETGILVMAALCHDLGKVKKTQIGEDGVIRSHGHEEAGVEPTESFLLHFADSTGKDTGFGANYRSAVEALVATHLRPKMFWLVAQRGEFPQRGIRSLARFLESRHTDLEMLILLAEADERGRNGESHEPLGRDDCLDIEQWQVWLRDQIQKLEIGKGGVEYRCSGKRVMQVLRDRGVKDGPWVGLVMRAVSDLLVLAENDQNISMDEMIWEYYERYDRRAEEISRSQGVDKRVAWRQMRASDDPLAYLDV